MAKYYFTYGTSRSMPFKGGWTEVEVIGAEPFDGSVACGAFRAVHPDPYPNAPLQCSSIYPEDRFKETSMCKMGRNLGQGCVEKIRVEVSRC